MTVALSKLVHEGAERGRFVFGAGGVPVAAAGLLDAGSRRFGAAAGGPAAGVLMTNDRPTVEVLLGAIATGTTLVSLPLPGRGTDPDEYAALLGRACAAHGVGEIVARDDLAGLLEGRGLAVRPHSRLADRPLAAPGAAGFRLVQFSSGSTGAPKSVVLDDAALGANVAGTLEHLRFRPGDDVVSWLPLSHDLGLVGMVLTLLSAMSGDWIGGGHIVLLEPTDFLRRPSLWLEALAHWRAGVTASPDFGYRLVTRRPPGATLDLSRLRVAIVGGEIVRAPTLAAFARAYAPHGLRPEALCPAYGMAEAGLAVTLTQPEEMWRHTVVATEALAAGRLRPPAAGEAATDLAASGPPLAAFDVDCGASGGPGRSGRSGRSGGSGGPGGSGGSAVGRISVRGPSLGVDGGTGTPYANADGWYRTGDVGFLDDGWLYVCGRADDYLVAHGRNVYAPAVDAAVGDLPGVRAGRVATVGLPTGHWVVVAELDGRDPVPPARVDRLRHDVGRAAVHATDTQPDDVLVVPRGTLPITPSGKLRRTEVAARLLRGDLPPAGLSPWRRTSG